MGRPSGPVSPGKTTAPHEPMANTCCTNYILVGPKPDLEAVKKAIEEAKEGLIGLSRIENVLAALGVKPSDKDLREDITGVYWSDDGKDLVVEAESSWDAKLDAWRDIRKQRFPNVKVFFQTEEFGCNYFNSNDPGGLYFPNKIAVDWGDDKDGGVDYFEDEDALVMWASKKFSKEFKNYEDARLFLEEELPEKQEDAYAVVHVRQDADWAYDMTCEIEEEKR